MYSRNVGHLTSDILIAKKMCHKIIMWHILYFYLLKELNYSSSPLESKLIATSSDF